MAVSTIQTIFARVAELADLPAGRQARKTKNSMFYVYAIASTTRKYIYVGLSNNISRRFQQHQYGKEKTTAPYRPFELILQEKYNTRAEARKREKYLKSGVGKEFLKYCPGGGIGRPACRQAGAQDFIYHAQMCISCVRDTKQD